MHDMVNIINSNEWKTYSSGEEIDSLIDSSQRRNINSLSSNSSLRSNTGRILTRSRVDDGIDNDLKWVLVSKQVNDLQSVLNDLDGLDLLSVVSSVHHERVDQSFNDGTLSLSESSLVVSTSSVRDVDEVFELFLDWNVVLQTDVRDLNIIERPKEGIRRTEKESIEIQVLKQKSKIHVTIMS